MMKNTNKELNDLDIMEDEDDRIEDRMIIQPDGSRACISYELAGRGYQIVNLNDDRREELNGQEM